jgi:hypothetical protein
LTATNRRLFILQVAGAATALSISAAHAQSGGVKLAETDPQAMALGYKEDTTKVDAKRFPNHAASQNCADCELFQGKPKDATGGCPLFAGKQVAAAGWCSAWTTNAA